MARKNTDFWASLDANMRDYYTYLNKYIELSICMFDWQNLPDTIDARFLELALFLDGHALFFQDEDLGYLGLRCAFGGTRNVYRIPTLRFPIADNAALFEPRNPDNSVIIWNNLLHQNSVVPVQDYAKRIYEIERTIDVNVKAQKTPVLIKCAENQRLSLKNAYMQYDGNQPFIFADKGFDEDSFKVLSTGAPYLADKLYTLKTQYNNECLTYLGISNVNVQKKERLLNDEVTRNMGGVLANRYSRLTARQKACDEINRIFPELHIWCEYREDTRYFDEDVMINDAETDKDESEGGGDNV